MTSHPTCRCGFEADVLDSKGTPWCSMHLPEPRPTVHLREVTAVIPDLVGYLNS